MPAPPSQSPQPPQCPKCDAAAISIRLIQGVAITLHLKCPSCGHTWDTPVPTGA
jgi:DNA-directed RNA polymerase subunit M/transcription elongation factor TFIIS